MAGWAGGRCLSTAGRSSRTGPALIPREGAAAAGAVPGRLEKRVPDEQKAGDELGAEAEVRGSLLTQIPWERGQDFPWHLVLVLAQEQSQVRPLVSSCGVQGNVTLMIYNEREKMGEI